MFLKIDKINCKPYKNIFTMKKIFVELMDAMLQYQDESGMWYQVVNVGGMDRNYLETSEVLFSDGIFIRKYEEI